MKRAIALVAAGFCAVGSGNASADDSECQLKVERVSPSGSTFPVGQSVKIVLEFKATSGTCSAKKIKLKRTPALNIAMQWRCLPPMGQTIPAGTYLESAAAKDLPSLSAKSRTGNSSRITFLDRDPSGGKFCYYPVHQQSDGTKEIFQVTSLTFE